MNQVILSSWNCTNCSWTAEHLKHLNDTGLQQAVAQHIATHYPPESTEIPYQAPFELWKTDNGIDGWDAKSWLVAHFTSREKAVNYLAERDYTFPGYSANQFRHKDIAKRHTMGEITYEIRERKITVPTDPI